MGQAEVDNFEIGHFYLLNSDIKATDDMLRANFLEVSKQIVESRREAKLKEMAGVANSSFGHEVPRIRNNADLRAQSANVEVKNALPNISGGLGKYDNLSPQPVSRKKGRVSDPSAQEMEGGGVNEIDLDPVFEAFGNQPIIDLSSPED